MERPGSIYDRICHQALIKAGQLTVVSAGERQEVGIGKVRGIQKPGWVDKLSVKQRQVVGPK
jgi:hypothetical protein